MSKRKPSKHSQSPKSAAKARPAAQAIVKNPSEPVPMLNNPIQEVLPVEHPATALETVLRSKHDEPQQHTLLVEHPATVLQTEAPPKPDGSGQEALPVVSPAIAIQDECKLTMTDSASRKALDSSPAPASVPAYQAKLQEMVQANMRFAFEFTERLTAIRSPVEFLIVMADFTNKRLAMLQKHSREMAEFGALR